MFHVVKKQLLYKITCLINIFFLFQVSFQTDSINGGDKRVSSISCKLKCVMPLHRIEILILQLCHT